MSFVPVDGGNIVTDFTIPFAGVDGSNIVTNFVDAVTTNQRALLVSGTGYRQILDSEVGTGLKPIVMMADGSIQQRRTTEGIPVIVVLNLRLLLDAETLIV